MIGRPGSKLWRKRRWLDKGYFESKPKSPRLGVVRKVDNQPTEKLIISRALYKAEVMFTYVTRCSIQWGISTTGVGKAILKR